MRHPKITAAALAVTLAAGLSTTAAAAANAATWSCVTTTDTGACGEYHDVNAGSNQAEYVVQDAWNPGPALTSQEVDANSMADWQVTASIAAGNKSVISYPDAQDTVTNTSGKPVPIASYTDITSSWQESNPAAGSTDDWESAFDIWLGTTSQNYSQEIMVWTYNHGQTPAGSDTGKTWTDPTTGSVYEIWATSSHSTVSFVAKVNAGTGSIDLLDLFKALQSGGLTSATGVNQVDYGWELCSTSGRQETFAVDSYTLDATGSGI